MGGKRGPTFGMHTPATNWSVTFRPHQRGRLVVFFDPNAHGRDGLGRVERAVIIFTDYQLAAEAVVRITARVVD